MDVQDYADAINVEIDIKRFANQDNRWIADFTDAEVMDGGGLSGVYGSGKSPAEALSDYVNKIVGKRIVMGAMTDKRREFDVPKGLSHNAT